MKNISAIVALLICCWSSHAQLFHDDYDCDEGSDLAVLDFFTDTSAQQNGWTLVCDSGGKVWDIQVGSLINAEGSWLTESSCIVTTTTCTFTFLDQGEDGLTGEGFVAFRYGATTLAVAEYGAAMSFSELTACFGPACDATALEVVEEQEAQIPEEKFSDQANDEQEDIGRDTGVFCTDEEEEVTFDIILDENPLDNGWSLACDNGDVLWDVAPASIVNTTGSWVTESACVATSLTCSFLLIDASGNGLTANGFYALRYGASTVASSEYGEAVVFSEEVFCFGPGCQKPLMEVFEENAETVSGETDDTTDSEEADDGDSNADTGASDTGHGSANDANDTGNDDVNDSIKIAPVARAAVNERKISTATLIGSVLGGVAVLFCIVVVSLMIYRKRSMETLIDIYANKSSDGTDSQAGSHTDSALNEALRGVTLARV